MDASHSSSCVLVVDDDIVSRMTLAGVMRHLPGVEVVEAQDGHEAWRLLEDGLRPLVCCTDLVMPEIDGLVLMDRIRSHPIHNDLSVVLITGTSDRDTVLGAMQRGAAGYIVKPFAAAETLATLLRVMRAALLRRAEAPAATRARLQQDVPTLARLLSTLRQQATNLARAQARDGEPGDLPMQLASLRSACLTLGLWRAAELLERFPSLADGGVGVVQVLREVEGCAADQLVRLRLPLFD